MFVSWNVRFLFQWLVLFCLFRFLRRILAGKISFARVAYKQSGEGEGSYPAGGVGYP
jgi:hypothetical protein